MRTLLASALLAAVAAGTLFGFHYAPASADTKQTAQAQQLKTTGLRSIAPGKGRLVEGKLKMTTAAAGVVCCTHWNTSTGGTGCATYPDQCPSNTFTVECGADGCW